LSPIGRISARIFKPDVVEERERLNATTTPWVHNNLVGVESDQGWSSGKNDGVGYALVDIGDYTAIDASVTCVFEGDVSVVLKG
jgi:hypothetical protein